MATVPSAITSDDYSWRPQACLICGAPLTRFLGKRGGAYHRSGSGVATEIWQCKSCELILPNPVPLPIHGPAQHYGVAAADYFSHHDETGKKQAGAELLDQAAAIIGGAGSLLDIGCGRGELLRAAVPRGWTAIGIETSPTFVEYASNASQATIYNRDLIDCRFESGRFDVAVLSGVLEHLYNPTDTIAEIARILRPGGALYVDVPNETGLYCRIGNLYYRLRGKKQCVNLSPTFSPYHVVGFNPRSLRLLLSRSGFAIHSWRCYSNKSCCGASGGIVSRVERAGADLVTALSNRGNLGSFIETWARKTAG